MSGWRELLLIPYKTAIVQYPNKLSAEKAAALWVFFHGDPAAELL